MKQVSVRQLELLVDFMEKHRMLALGRVRGKEGHILSTKLWTELAAILNSETADPSMYRSAKEWNKFYNDYKCRIKNKSRKIGQSQRKTGGGPSEAQPLSELEERLCSILGNKFVGLPVRQNPIPTSETEDIIIPLDHTNITGDSQINFEVETLEIMDSETPLRVENENTTIDDIQPSTSSSFNVPVDKAKTETLNSNRSFHNNIKKGKSQRISRRDPKDTEVEKAKTVLADLEKARLELNKSQIQVQLERNEIEKNKVNAINNLASAAWALVNIFKGGQEGNKRKCDDTQETSEYKRARSQSSDDDDHSFVF
ncbi:unnamed protein product [Spodoptera littoralis]|uniref:Regulatory protein zeste n=1 Tax=Spodoptera littoralis TaxID=7109 RepID=A0A9P0IGS9_SPOLI|nr:unnamed protein product [Spodoptera littoralis]CAH1645557.1 unnamed protein product [Spodoptera littoralis]